MTKDRNSRGSERGCERANGDDNGDPILPASAPLSRVVLDVDVLDVNRRQGTLWFRVRRRQGSRGVLDVAQFGVRSESCLGRIGPFGQSLLSVSRVLRRKVVVRGLGGVDVEVKSSMTSRVYRTRCRRQCAERRSRSDRIWIELRAGHVEREQESGKGGEWEVNLRLVGGSHLR